jgi:squalene synthase HpnC
VALYHFARTADDLADEGTATADQRLDALNRYREQLVLAADSLPLARGEWAWVFEPLRTVLVRHDLPLNLLHALLDAFVQDVDMTARQAGYADEAQLLDYCSRSANPVGRLLLHLYGVRNPEALAQSDAICTALQLINFWQDCGLDLTRGRCYFPADWMRQHGTDQAALRSGTSHAGEEALMAHCVQHARQLMASGAPLVHQVPGRAGWELRLVVQGGLRIAHRIEAMGYDTLRQRPKLGRRDVAAMVWGSCWM